MVRSRWITPGERALVNIYAVGNPNEIGNPNETPWDFVVRVFDRRGAIIQQQRLQLARGVIGSVELAVQDEENTTVPAEPPDISRGDRRVQPAAGPPGKWAVTLEVVDRLTGRTSLLLGGPDTLPAAPVGTPRSN